MIQVIDYSQLRQQTLPPGFIEFPLTAIELQAKPGSIDLYTISSLQQPILAEMTAALKAGIPLMISKVQITGIIAVDMTLPRGVGVVPGNKINRVGEITSRSAAVASLILVLRPSAVQRLRITCGQGRSRPGDNPQDSSARWFCTCPKRRFLIDEHERQVDRYGYVPALLCSFRGFIPGFSMLKYLTAVKHIPGRC